MSDDKILFKSKMINIIGAPAVKISNKCACAHMLVISQYLMLLNFNKRVQITMFAV